MQGTQFPAGVWGSAPSVSPKEGGNGMKRIGSVNSGMMGALFPFFLSFCHF